MMRELEIRITNPGGAILDVTDRLSDVGTLTESLDGEEFLRFIHGDIDFELNDIDGEVEHWFRFMVPGDVYTVEIRRETGRRRPKWEVLFCGRLDLPHSLEFDRRAKTVDLQVFSLSKALDDASGEDVKRSLEGRTGSVTSGTNIVTPSSVTDLEVGDEVTLKDADNEETHEIATVGGSTFTTVSNWSNDFTSAELIVETPFYRDKSVEWLADQLFQQTSLDDWDISVGQLLAENPFAFRVESDYADNWTQTDLNAHDYTLEERNPSGNDFELWLLDNGVDVAMIDSFTDTLGEGYGTNDFDLEYDATNSYIWVSFRRLESDYEKLFVVNTSGVTQFTIYAGVASGGYGQLRRLFEETPVMGFKIDDLTDMQRRRLSDGWLLSTETVPLTFLIHTAAVIDDNKRASGVYQTGGNFWVRVFTIGGGTWTEESSNRVSTGVAGGATGNSYETGTENAAFGQAGAQYYAVSKSFGGVIEYADFDGMSVADALKELALLTGSIVQVDRYGVGQFYARSAQLGEEPIEITDPLRRQTRALSTWYRDSVKVTGKTLDDVDVEVIVGEAASSDHRLEIESDLITSEELAGVVGNVYLALLDVDREHDRITIREGDETIRPLSHVTYPDGREFLVVSSELDVDDGEQDLELLEII